jgi:nicotinamide-nucleotide amidase
VSLRRPILPYRERVTRHSIERAELLAVGTELLVGETQDTNSGELARELTALGVEVLRTTALPDRLDAVTDAFRRGLANGDLVISTGGLGPTPDDLTREAIAGATGLTPTVDPELEAWLRGLFERRSIPFVQANLKQAWLLPGAEALPNPNGTAPGWWLQTNAGPVIVALPGPPREMRPMWRDQVVPRLRALGVGADRYAVTLRLTGIGESALVDVIGEDVLRRRNPEVATYARVDAVDVRVSASGDAAASARELVDRAVAALLPAIGKYVFAHGAETWADALTHRLAGRTVSLTEVGTGGSVTTLLSNAEWLLYAELLGGASALARAHRGAASYAERVREVGGTDLGLAVRVRERGGDTAVTVAVAGAGRETSQVTRTAFLGGETGRRRAALIAAAELWTRLGDTGTP